MATGARGRGCDADVGHPGHLPCRATFAAAAALVSVHWSRRPVSTQSGSGPAGLAGDAPDWRQMTVLLVMAAPATLMATACCQFDFCHTRSASARPRPRALAGRAGPGSVRQVVAGGASAPEHSCDNAAIRHRIAQALNVAFGGPYCDSPADVGSIPRTAPATPSLDAGPSYLGLPRHKWTSAGRPL